MVRAAGWLRSSFSNYLRPRLECFLGELDVDYLKAIKAYVL